MMHCWPALRDELAPDLKQAAGRCYADIASDRLFMVLLAAILYALIPLYLLGGYHAGFAALNDFAPALPPAFWQNLTWLGDEHLLFASALLFARRNPKLLWALMLAAVVGALAARGLKVWVGAMRPPAVLEPGSFNLIGEARHGKSFPSGHTLTAFVFAGVWLYVYRLRALPLLLLAAGVALSRVMLGVHWPIDVLVGAGLGLAAAWVGARLADRWSWGLRPLPHLLLLLLPLAMLLRMAVNDNGYPLTGELRFVAGWLALTVFLFDYPFRCQELRR